MKKIAVDPQFDSLALRVADYAASGRLDVSVDELLADFRADLHDFVEVVEQDVIQIQTALVNETKATIRFLESLPPGTKVYDLNVPMKKTL